MATHDGEFPAAKARAAARLAKTPRAVSARYDQCAGRIRIELSSGLGVSFDPHDAQGLEAAKPEDLARIEITPSGMGLHVPALDADLYLPALLEGFLGSRQWMAAVLGKAGAGVRAKPRPLRRGRTESAGGVRRNRASPFRRD